MEHTKGPWNSGPFHGAQGIETQSEKRAVAVAIQGNLTFEETQANAQLIAAAPEMYETLKELLTCSEGAFPYARTQAWKVIAKAEGRN